MVNIRICLSCIASMLFVLGAELMSPQVALAHQAALAHGAASLNGNACVMAVGPHKLYFAGYAPETRPADEFCGDFPEAGKTIIVFDQENNSLRRMAMSVRIVRDGRRPGARAQHEQPGFGRELEASTVFYKAPETYSDGNMSIELNLARGSYMGIVTLSDPETGREYASAFPFSAGYGEGNMTLAGLIRALLALTTVGAAAYFVALGPQYFSKPSRSGSPARRKPLWEPLPH